MALSAKDAAATVLAAGVAAVLYVQAKGVDVAVLSSPRWAAGLIAVLSIAMCIASSDPAVAKTGWGSAMGAVGGLVFLAALVGLITGSKVYAEIGAGLVLVMWLLATGRHLLG